MEWTIGIVCAICAFEMCQVTMYYQRMDPQRSPGDWCKGHDCPSSRARYLGRLQKAGDTARIHTRVECNTHTLAFACVTVDASQITPGRLKVTGICHIFSTGCPCVDHSCRAAICAIQQALEVEYHFGARTVYTAPLNFNRSSQ